MSKLILLHNSHWSNNIGNSFFTLGIKYILESALPDAQVLQTEQVSTLAWHQPRSIIEKNDLRYPGCSEPDWFVMSGPMFKRKAISKIEPILDQVFRDNDQTKLVIMNAGSIDYDSEEVKKCREVLRKYPFYMLTTRDEYTYEKYSDLAEYSYNGIDAAFFCNDYYPGYETPKLKNYVTLTFDKQTEPEIDLTDFGPRDSSTWNSVYVRGGSTKLFRINKYLDLLRSYPSEIDGYTIVRPSHKTQGQNGLALYRLPNSFASQTPFGYLNLYSNTSLTVSDRVHACIPTLAYGHPARLVSRTKRQALFQRVGLGDINQQVMVIDRDYLIEEKEKYIDFVRATADADVGSVSTA
jgi:hypothetical protein